MAWVIVFPLAELVADDDDVVVSTISSSISPASDEDPRMDVIRISLQQRI